MYLVFVLFSPLLFLQFILDKGTCMLPCDRGIIDGTTGSVSWHRSRRVFDAKRGSYILYQRSLD